MKKILLSTVIFGALLTSSESKSQLGLNVNLHIGNRPSWGLPASVNAGYYYMPEIDTYYDLANQQFIYEDGGQWVFAASLPVYYRNYDLRNGYKVLVNERRPYMRADFYRRQYSNNYNTYRRENYDRGNMRPGYRNDYRFNSYDNRAGRSAYDERNNQPRNDDHRFDQRNNENMNWGHNDQRNNRADNRHEERPDITVPQQQQRHDDRKDVNTDKRENNADQGRNKGGDANKGYAPGQVRTAQRRGQ